MREWRTRDYQAPVLKRAALIDAARRGDWTKLPEMIAYISDPKHDEVFATSLIRLIPPTQDPKAQDALFGAAKDTSPLVRGAAVQVLGLIPTTGSLQTLVEATGDDYRLVRVRAAAGVAAFPRMTAPPAYQAQLKRSEQEYIAFITARPDQWMSHYNMGNYQLGRGETKKAVASYQAALKLEPQAIMAMVNLSIAYARMGVSGKSEQALRQALKVAPENSSATSTWGSLRLRRMS